MKPFVAILLGVLSSGASADGFFPSRWMAFGPMAHWNFGKEGVRFSFGAELSYWQWVEGNDTRHSFWQGLDLGIEFQGSTRRVYSEYQVGQIFFGSSIGGVVEWSRDRTSLGFQAGLWGNCFVGGDLRGRYFPGQPPVLAPGLYGRIPLPLQGRDIPMGGA